MSVYKLTEIVGTGGSVDECVQSALSRASKTLRNISWFEVQEVRGTVNDGKVGEFQVKLKVGFRIDD